MRVFVLIYDEWYGESRVLGVFDSVASAQASDKIEKSSPYVYQDWKQEEAGDIVSYICLPVPDDLEEPKVFAQYTISAFALASA
jgi:hypothetical protein